MIMLEYMLHKICIAKRASSKCDSVLGFVEKLVSVFVGLNRNFFGILTVRKNLASTKQLPLMVYG